MASRPFDLSIPRLLWRDAVRALAATPSATLLAIVTLTLGLGSAVAIFSIVNGVLLKPIPYYEPDRVVVVWESRIESNGEPNVVSPGNYLAWREQNQVFQQMAAISFQMTSTMTGRGPATRVPIRLMSRELPELLGIRMALGRPFTAEEDRQRSGVAIISHRAWVQRFNSDSAIIGHAVTIDGEPRRIVGVLPAGVTVLDQDSDIWLPTGFDESARTPRGRWIIVLARLKPGVSIEQAQSNMTLVASRLTKQWPDFDTNWTAKVIGIDDELVGGARRALLFLALSAAVVLIIACANVAGLMLARATTRARELAVRTALGAGRGRLTLQIFAESALVSIAGGIGGLVLAHVLLRSVVVLAGDTKAVPRLADASIDGTAAMVSLALTALATIAVGMAPALGTIRQDVVRLLAMGSRSNTAHAGARLRQVLASVQMALAIVLLIFAGLLARSVYRLLSVSPGFSTAHVITFELPAPEWKHDTPAKVTALYDRVLDGIKALPGVQAVGANTWLPLNGMGAATIFEVLGKPKPPVGDEPVADIRIITGDYFRALQIPLRVGRLFGPQDGPGSRVVIVDEAMARASWPGQDPIGRQVKVMWNDDTPQTVVGVVGDIRPARLDHAGRATIYWPLTSDARSTMGMVVRAASDESALVPAVERLIGTIEPDATVSDVRTMDGIVTRSVASRRLPMLLLVLFAATALVLAAVGLFALVSYTVTSRRRELGIRMAVGAAARDVRRWVLAYALRVALPGATAGVLVSWLGARYLSELLFETSPTDLATFASAALLLTAVVLVAAWVPARRAGRVDPAETLRAD